ncbi:MAG: DUF3237 domain-containing protein [Proteobacteria bacterium]|nr:MAG: DUF3237 domain-containing protein [Pseudomonadota bacterium]
MTNPPAPPVSVTPGLRLLYSSRVGIATPHQLGRSPYGERRIINISGGEFAGPRLSGRILPGGADWQVVRDDGVAEVDARYTLETGEGDLIYVSDWGLRYGPADVIQRLSRGEDVDPGSYYFRTTPRFETGSQRYDWLNRMVAVAVGERRRNEVVITVYEVT